MLNVLVTGSDGQLGSELKDLEKDYTDYKFYFTNKKTLNITDSQAVKHYVEKNNIDVIINCAAYTDVDKAEKDVEKCYRINHDAVATIAKLAKSKAISLVHISTDYVFDGKNVKPYLESDIPNPQTIYGKSKWAGENAVLNENPEKSIIIRTSWLYSKYGNNFVRTMLKLASNKKEVSIVEDQLGTPTNARLLAKFILNVLHQLNNSAVEIYHFTNSGSCTWFEFSKTIFKSCGIDINVKPILSSQYSTLAVRPSFSVLNNGKIKEKFAIDIPNWKDSFFEYVLTIK